ncbi:MAG: hypothetical protein B6U89_01735 [Desulfurococcales archaeon ex4484_58]|nr:MAG: hypothetical protein B6U89_01735 [Desulfurococcales archaeon ex4484_58]
MDMDRKYLLIRLIVNAGLEEDFMTWLKDRGYEDLYGRLDNIPLDIIEEYVNSRKLLDTSDDYELIKEINSIDYDDEHGKGYIRAKKNHYSNKRVSI